MNDQNGREGAIAPRHESVEPEFLAVDLFVYDIPCALEAVLLGGHSGDEPKQ
ncbi:MAG: hypothetical protein VX392_03245 [Verrucomicrobiota bacterium]|nr:hypothetical protein [Verrucomicrobiota bacterium]